ncbi:DUF2637 domain-containing protein [Kitasatospora sp. NRRL B-11411]|uniref:DUF2637 domain-containing protein n=1 Tax=Kitasatospora sp. NRRL B-11411 TaxID=1463822 RepID=UPI0004C43DC6|nr:DUF2637 domain-containing protein [Kitasatospora sp. NRRL B-11411]
MNLSSIQLVWAVVGGAALLFTAILVAFLRFKNNKPAESASGDSWERSEERRRRKEAVYGGASYVLLFCCAGVAAALSFHGLVGFGQQNLNLSGGWEYLVPFGLDGAAMFCSVLAVREASHGDAALGSRMLVWLFAVASAWFNWVHAPRGGAHDGAPQFFAGMSISAAVLFDRALKQTRRAALREQGLVPRPLPQIRVVRWLRAPRETYAAWSLMGRARHAREVPALAAAGSDGPSAAEPALAPEETTLDRVSASALEPAALNAGRRPRAAVESTGSSTSGSSSSSSYASSGSSSYGSSYSSSIDLTMDEDTLSMPKLDSLERKLRAIEQQLG